MPTDKNRSYRAEQIQRFRVRFGLFEPNMPEANLIDQEWDEIDQEQIEQIVQLLSQPS